MRPTCTTALRILGSVHRIGICSLIVFKWCLCQTTLLVVSCSPVISFIWDLNWRESSIGLRLVGTCLSYRYSAVLQDEVSSLLYLWTRRLIQDILFLHHFFDCSDLLGRFTIRYMRGLFVRRFVASNSAMNGPLVSLQWSDNSTSDQASSQKPSPVLRLLSCDLVYRWGGGCKGSPNQCSVKCTAIQLLLLLHIIIIYNWLLYLMLLQVSIHYLGYPVY